MVVTIHRKFTTFAEIGLDSKLLAALKPKIPGALMRQHTAVTNSKLIILVPLNAKLQPLTFRSLEGNVIGMGMMVMTVAVMVVRLSSHIHNCGRYCQNGRILILNKLADILRNDIEEQDKPN